jgi:hypothetical protein
MKQPYLVVAADWSKSWEGRWLAEAVREGEGYSISHPRPVGPPESLVGALLERLPEGESALLALDFPIGLPRNYARLRAIRSFRQWLADLSDQEWERFSEVTDTPNLEQPFGPKSNKKGSLLKPQLAAALGLTETRLYRVCENTASGSPASLFFTNHPSQVGKAALHGWGSVIRPNLERIRLWPFDGTLEELLDQPGVVVAEIYPAAFVELLALPKTVKSTTGTTIRSKNKAEYRLAEKVQKRLMEATEESRVTFTPSAIDWIERGFGASHDFDALVSLLGMLKTVAELPDGGLGSRDPEGRVRSVEGWIWGVKAEVLPA